MTKLKAQLIVSDFDGTLITSDGRILPVVQSAISKYIADGGIFAVCTGRILSSILPRVRSLGLGGLVVACQGSVIADIATGEYIRRDGLTPEQAAEVCAAIEGLGEHVNAYCGDGFVTDIPEGNVYLKKYEEITGVTASHTDIPVSRHVLEKGLVCQKVASLCTPSSRKKLYDGLSSLFAGKYDVTCSADVLVEVSPAGDTKGEALKFLASHYGIDIAKTVAVGDNLNDLSMIEAAGTGVAVGNAVEELKARADFVALTNDEGAVAQVIEKFGYGNE